MARTAVKKRICKECRSTTRPAPNPGPRCATCNRERRKVNRDTSWERRLLALYGITGDEYWAIYELQGGRCYICRRGTGVRKRLSVDHCHKTGRVRGLLDTGCNKWVLGLLRDDTEALQRAIDYLTDPPAFSVVGERIVPDMRDADLTLNKKESDALQG